MQKIKKGDEVLVTTGKDKGKKGKVLSVFPSEQKVLVENLNQVTKHVKPNPNLGVEGGVQRISMPLPLSNVALIDPKSGKPTRVGIRILPDGKKVRIAKATSEIIDAAN